MEKLTVAALNNAMKLRIDRIKTSDSDASAKSAGVAKTSMKKCGPDAVDNLRILSARRTFGKRV